MESEFIPRRMALAAPESLDSFRAVVVQGARQVGKSTLAGILAEQIGARVVTLDREEDLAAARDDPPTFLEALGTPGVIDEVQRAGDALILAIKQRLDGSRRPGQYILTGSTNFLTTPAISESLAGRIDLVTLWPLSMGELANGNDVFIDRAFASFADLPVHRGPTPSRNEYLDLVCGGGYPEPSRLGERARTRWFERYLETVLRREVETAADLGRMDALFTMARLLIATTGSELVISRLAEQLRIDRATAEDYEPWIETTFLVHRVPAWSRKVSSKMVRRPKLHLCDSALGAAIIGKGPQALARISDPSVGPLIESFVIAELSKQLGWSTTSAPFHHLRDSDGLEVDGILESADGSVVAVEVKASTVPRTNDAAAMAALRDRLDRVGPDFIGGVVLHTGDRRCRSATGSLAYQSPTSGPERRARPLRARWRWRCPTTGSSTAMCSSSPVRIPASLSGGTPGRGVLGRKRRAPDPSRARASWGLTIWRRSMTSPESAMSLSMTLVSSISLRTVGVRSPSAHLSGSTTLEVCQSPRS